MAISQAWQQYKHLNKVYGHKLRQFCDNSIIWVSNVCVGEYRARTDDRVHTCQIHGYELFLVPTFLTMHAAQSKTPIAFFLPTPFPSSEVDSPPTSLPACLCLGTRLPMSVHPCTLAHPRRAQVFRTLSTCKAVLWGLLSVDQICFTIYDHKR